jgi:hypothetical protein
LQEALTDALKKDEEEEEETAGSNGYHTNGNGYPKTLPALAAEPAGDPAAKAAAGDEWDF